MKKKLAVIAIALLMIAVFCCVKAGGIVNLFTNDIGNGSMNTPDDTDERTVYFDYDRDDDD